MRVALIDYRAGNLTSVRKALAAVGADVQTPQRPADLEHAEGVIVPGVGNFARTAALDREWRDAILGVVERGRPHTVVDLGVKAARVGDLPTELVHDFFEGFALGVRGNVHVKVLYGRSSHHHVEAVFKAFGRALRVACSRDRQLRRTLPSTKGLL